MQTHFRNYEELATTPSRKLALLVADAGLNALAPETLLRRALSFDPQNRVLKIGNLSFALDNGRIFVIGGGKAADVMAAALENLLGASNIIAGIVICKTQSARTQTIAVRETSHPVPDSRGISAMAELMALKEKHGIGKNDLVICLLSGGASALMPAPATGISLEDKQALTHSLLECGADISEINLVRKHLSRAKGGKLGAHFAPATVASLIVSDVIGNDLASIGSGPTHPEKSKPQDAIDVLQRFGLWEKVPTAVHKHLEKSAGESALESLPNCVNLVIGDSGTALQAMKDAATQQGKPTRILGSAFKGNPETVVRTIAHDILEGVYREYSVLLAAGETTPVLPPNHGKGGRNQHFAAATLEALTDFPGDWAHLCLGSDGSDYLPEVAGALVDRQTLEQGKRQGIDLRDHLNRFDAYSFFHEVGNSLAVTGPTGTNVGDLMVYAL